MEDKSKSNFNQKSPVKAGRPKSQQKRRDVLDAATSLFLELGFSATSMDLVASRAGVSKQTVYSHFKNKDTLFTAIIDLKCTEYQFDQQHLQQPELSFEQVLTQFGIKFIRLLHDEDVIAMYRVVIGEAVANPRVAELFYQAGPLHSIKLLADYFINQTQLRNDKKSAFHWSVLFFNMLKDDYHMRSMMGLDFALTDTEQQKIVTTSVAHICKLMLK